MGSPVLMMLTRQAFAPQPVEIPFWFREKDVRTAIQLVEMAAQAPARSNQAIHAPKLFLASVPLSVETEKSFCQSCATTVLPW